MDEREAFEKWAGKRGYLWLEGSEKIWEIDSNPAFEAWQAALDSQKNNWEFWKDLCDKNLEIAQQALRQRDSQSAELAKAHKRIAELEMPAIRKAAGFKE